MNIFVVLVLLTTAVHAQYWTIHNQTSIVQHGPGYRQNITVVNTTYVQNPGYGPGAVGRPQQQPPQYGFRPNYDPYGGYINQTGRRNSGNDLKVGSPGPGDIMLYKAWYTKASRLFQTREKIDTYPHNPWMSQNTITAIAFFDLAKVPGGHAAILSGGVGHRNVTFRLFSDRSCGFNYKVVIHGR